MNPMLSIITICYNSASTIKDTIDSVLSQSFNDYEYIIVDGGSTDGTLNIIKSYEKKFGSKLRWISESDNGIYDAMNKGIQLSCGEYIGFINSDDWYSKDALTIIGMELMTKQDVYYGLLNVWQNNKCIRTYANHPENIRYESLAHPSVFIKKQAYIDCGLYDLKYRSASDYTMFISLVNMGKTFKFIDREISNFRKGGISGTSVGYFETLEIKLSYNFISRTKYSFLFIKKKFIDNIRKFIHWMV